MNTHSVLTKELNLPFKPSSTMDYHEAIVKTSSNQLHVGYLVDDDDCRNPLEDSCGMGQIYTAHRDSTTHAEMQEALGLDSSWEPDLDLVVEFISEMRKSWITTAANSSEFKQWCDETAGNRASFTDKYYTYRARKQWELSDEEIFYGQESIGYFDFTHDVMLNFWQELKDSGKIGNLDAVALDCYEHGGQVWSLSGEGMSCRWDTSSDAGVWVPDESALEEVTRRAAIYAFGNVYCNNKTGPYKRYEGIYRDKKGEILENSEEFQSWGEAFRWLESKTKGKTATEAQLTKGRNRALRELAREAVNTYNRWLAGATFGAVQATFSIKGSKEEQQYEFIESDECWGFIGEEHALDFLKDELS